MSTQYNGWTSPLSVERVNLQSAYQNQASKGNIHVLIDKAYMA